jgi:hypothetical protein
MQSEDELFQLCARELWRQIRRESRAQRSRCGSRHGVLGPTRGVLCQLDASFLNSSQPSRPARGGAMHRPLAANP